MPQLTPPKPKRLRPIRRHGAVLPMFAFIFPVLLIFAGFAINLAYMQMVSTDLKIATDASAHAGGRAMSILQSTDASIEHANAIGQMNLVGGRSLTIGDNSADELQVGFGISQRSNNGYGMYQFTEYTKAQVDNGQERANSVSVTSRVNLPLVFQAMSFQTFGGKTTHFYTKRRSIATQVDRDVALVLDISGSMIWYMDETALMDLLDTLHNTYETSTQGNWGYATWQWQNSRWRWRGYLWPSEIPNNSNWWTDWNDWKWETRTVNDRLITTTERNQAKEYLYNRVYTNNVIYQIEKYLNPGHSLGDSFDASKQHLLTTPAAMYAYDYQYHYKTNQHSPRYSRWYFLDLGVQAFLDILDTTDQIELVSLSTFNSWANVETQLTQDYTPIRSFMHNYIPWHGTAIGSGMQAGYPTIVSGPDARPFAAKTVVVMTDGQNNAGPNPVSVAQQIVANNNVTIHTVTFTFEADQASMQTIANVGGGKHYHSNEGDELVQIFEEIANNLPTILTE